MRATLSPPKSKSSGRAGEKCAEYWFNKHGWKMYRIAPPSRVVRRMGNLREGDILRIIYTGKGYPDFMGHEMIDEEGEYPNKHSRSLQPNFRACEVKEAKPCEGDSAPASGNTPRGREPPGRSAPAAGIPSLGSWAGA